MKSTGRIIFSFLLLFLWSGLYAVEIETELTPSRITVGEEATLRFRITGKSSNVKPVKFPAISGLEITFSGSSRNFQFVNGKTWSGTVLNFSIYGLKKGEYKIPPFILESDGERISSREVTLTVGSSSSGSNGSEPVRGDISLSTDTVYAGEPFIMRYFIYNGDQESPDVHGFSELPHVKGFAMKELSERIDEQGKTHAGSFYLVPVDKGVQQIGGGTVEVSVEMSRGFFSMSGRKRIVFPYKEIRVVPIPVNGKPDRFAGDVGEFKIEAQIPEGEFNIFEEIKIPVKISGKGNILTISKPVIENQENIKAIIEEKDQTLSADGGTLSGVKNFVITVIPQKDGEINAGSAFIEYFNPYKKAYEKTASAPLKFIIKKSISTPEKSEVQFSSDGIAQSKLNYLYAVPVILLLFIIVIALVMWERKKMKMIRTEFNPGTGIETETPEVNKNHEILTNLKSAITENNNETFLYNADRGVNQINSASLSVEQLDIFNRFKDKIYYCRYGGGLFADNEMNELYEWLRKNLK